MKKINFRIRAYQSKDTACSVINALRIPEVICIDMESAKALPVPLVCACLHLWNYVLCDALCERQQIFSGRSIRFCKALISLIKSRIYS